MIGMICDQCGHEVNEVYEVVGYLGVYQFCLDCFGDEEDGFDEDWIDEFEEEVFIYGY